MATLGLRALLMIAGAGYTGSFVYHNMDLARALASRILQQTDRSASSTGANGSAATGGATAASGTTVDVLAKQLEQLTREFTKSRDAPVVVVPAGVGGRGVERVVATLSDVLNLMGWAVVFVSVAGVGYIVAVKRKVGLRDLVWVSRARFNETVAAMEQGIGRIRGVVGAVKRELGDRLRVLDGRVEDVRGVAGRIGVEVSEVKEGVDGLGKDIWGVRCAMDEVGDRMDQMDGKLDKTNDGIYALVKLVYAAIGGGPGRHEGLTELRKFMLHMEQDKAGGPLLVSGDSKTASRGAGLKHRLSEDRISRNGLGIMMRSHDADLSAFAKAAPDATVDANKPDVTSLT